MCTQKKNCAKPSGKMGFENLRTAELHCWTMYGTNVKIKQSANSFGALPSI